MSDHTIGFTVVLSDAIGEDEAVMLRNAISAIRGVVQVGGVVADAHDYINRESIRHEMRGKLWRALLEGKPTP